MKISTLGAVLCVGAMCVTACSAAPGSEGEGTGSNSPAENVGSRTAAEHVTVSWATTDATTHAVAIRSAQISREQAQWIRDARQAKRAGKTVPGKPGATTNVASKAQALTEGASDWEVCADHSWIYFTSDHDWGGDIFCAHYVEPDAIDATIQLPFVPGTVDAADQSPAFFNICSAPTGCFESECGFGGENIWGSVYQNTGALNLYSPYPVLYVAAQRYPGVC